jgi:hypothetical protein
MEVTAEALNSPLQGKLQAIVILVKDLDLIAGFTDSHTMTVEEIQEQPDGSKQTVRIDAKRGQWQVDNHGVNRHALIKDYDVPREKP